MPTAQLLDALTRTERLLFSRNGVESFLARHEAGEHDDVDADTRRALAAELVTHQSDDGSWGRSLTHTTESVLILTSLRPLNEELESSIERAAAWIRTTGLYSPGAATFAFERKNTAGSAVGTLDILRIDALLAAGERVDEPLRQLIAMQRADGTWPGADTFHVIDTILTAVRTGYDADAFDRAIARTAEMLALSQHADGSWGNASGDYRLLTGWRVLRHAAGNRAKVLT